MRRDFILGGWYGDFLPSGAFCVTVPHQGIATHRGWVSLPPGEAFGICYPRCTDVGSFRFAGQAHDTNNPACWEYDGAWTSYPPPCLGVSPTIYDRLGVLHRSDGSVGSQGYRYVTESNQIVSGDQTYGPFYGLFEYTALDDRLWIGQAAENRDGVRVWDGTTLRQLETGDCRFVRANRDGETVAIAFTRQGEGVVLMMTTMAELRALPPVQTAPQIPKPIPPKEPPVSFQPIRLPDAAQAIVEALYLQFKHLAHGSDEQRRELTGKIAETVRFTLGPAWGWKKAGGPPSKDSIAKRDGAVIHGFDLFAGDTRLPADHPTSVDISAQTFIEVAPVNHLGGVVPSPPVPVPSPTPSDPAPDFDQWIGVEYPQVRAAFVKRQGRAPDDQWAAFITRRRYAKWIDGKEDWPLARLIAHELGVG